MIINLVIKFFTEIIVKRTYGGVYIITFDISLFLLILKTTVKIILLLITI